MHRAPPGNRRMYIDQAISRNEQQAPLEQVSKHISEANGFAVTKEDASETAAKYAIERDKRLRQDGDDQFITLHESHKYKHMTVDPWLPTDGAVAGYKLSTNKHLHFKFILKGAGYAGLMYAARLLEAGYKPEDMVMIDYAGGFGGTWYWNRYPGLMCDVAAEVYMPLLEETNYIPKTKYAYGQELREHADRIAEQYGISQRGIFRATIGDAVWNESNANWELSVTQEQGPRQASSKVSTTITGDYVFSLAGVLNFPKLPNLPDMGTYLGHQFHTSRWDYNYTGGSQSQPAMVNLKDKRVGLVGTGATAIQVVSHLAKWAKELYIIQRTPSAVDVRNQTTINPEHWKLHVANEPGWQRKRRENMAAFVSDVPEKPVEDMVNDGWTSIPGYASLVGGPNSVDPRVPNSITKHVQDKYAIDQPRQERIRARVGKIVHDPVIASQLKPWYPSWCKRPCFHDDYLPVFNQPNVHLLDTEGRGIEKMTQEGLVISGKETRIDVLIWASGFSLGGGADSRGQYVVRGKNGKSMAAKFEKTGLATLHGAVSKDFPNFFMPGPHQAGATANQVHMIDLVCEHTIHMIKTAEGRHPNKKILIEPSAAAEEEWAMRVASFSTALAAIQGCTPSYLNREGEASAVKDAPIDIQLKAARMGTWGQGILDYTKVLKDWRDNRDMSDLEVTVC